MIAWNQLLAFNVSPLEIIVRGTLVYLGVLAMMRLAGRRATGALATADLLVVVVIADAVQNGMAGDQKSVSDALLLGATIIAWDKLLDWLSYHSKFVQHLLQPSALLLIRDGQLLRRNLRRELISPDELRSLLREHEIDDFAQVKRCYLEGDGNLSVLKADS